MGRDDRMGQRMDLQDACEMQFLTRTDDRRKYKIDVLNLSANALAAKIPKNHDIVDDYGDVINGAVFLWHSIWAEDRKVENWRRGFLSIAQRINSSHWKWVFFFDRKYPLPESE